MDTGNTRCSDLYYDNHGPKDDTELKTPSIMHCCIKQLTTNILSNQEQLIRTAISYKIGNDNWEPQKIKHRGHWKVLPDTTTIFCFDGEDLIHFMNPCTEHIYGVFSSSIKLVQNYRILYKEE